ncbi:MAG: YraN family protein [Bifidobacteriaceae bacterium]|jgi:putative endonuclease|nr:YraN family protein [Bifidobacteriaceae bacterium]
MGSDERRELGRYGERVAANYLALRGWRVLERNWRCRFGEIDLVAQPEPGSVVFVEVKTRSGDICGAGEEAVTPAKLARLRRLAGIWLEERGGARPAARIDVIAVNTGGGRGRSLRHYENVGWGAGE